MAAVVINVEMDVFVPERTWLLRMPLVAAFAAQVAKLRGVVLILDHRDKTYFFWLYVVLTAIQGLIALWAIVLGCPSMSGLQLPWGSLRTGYEVRPRASHHGTNCRDLHSITIALCTVKYASGHLSHLEFCLWRKCTKWTVGHVGMLHRSQRKRHLMCCADHAVLRALQKVVLCRSLRADTGDLLGSGLRREEKHTRYAHVLQELPPTEFAVAIESSAEVCPEYKSNILSQLSFAWLTPLMKKGYAHPLEFNDIWKLPPPDKVTDVHAELDRHWRKQLETGARPYSLQGTCRYGAPLPAWSDSASVYCLPLLHGAH